MAKDPRFKRVVINQVQKTDSSEEKSTEKEKQYITGNDIANNTILADHLTNNSITGNKLAALSLINPVHCANQLSATPTAGWVRVAQLNNLSAVEFWVMVTRSGNHNIAKFVGTYCFMGSGTPQISFNMLSNARFGDGFTFGRIVYKGTYDPIYFELYVPYPNSFMSIGQISAFGNTVSNFSNITLIAGTIPTDYSATQLYLGGSNSAALTV